MFGSEHRSRRPVLLFLVYGTFLVLIGITASFQAVMVTSHFSTATMNNLVGGDAAAVRNFVNDYVAVDYLEPGAILTAEEQDALRSRLAILVRRGELVHVEIRRPDGTVVASNDPAASGTAADIDPAFAAALGGTAQVGLVPGADANAAVRLDHAELLREYLPIAADGEVMAVVAIWRDAAPILAQLDGLRRDVVLVTLSAAVLASVLLFFIFRKAQARLTRQTEALIETTRRDPLTGSLNHGALVAHLASEIETAREAGTPLGVALLDLDNFRLLNDNHGHRAGDEALLVLAQLLDERLPDGIVHGRYGPDEFLLVAPPEHVADLEPAIDGIRAALVDLSLQFDATERLPVTISGGICTYPVHGASVTVLLSTTAATLEEAKASGGDAVRVAGANAAEEAKATTSFDVLQGLVFAVDTKDRYTKRHSEDVARYAVFLAQRLGLDPDFIRSVHLAGLLHDIGKIGIPDQILRKPGKLTAEEYEIVKQHVALGDSIVRELPDLDVVRAGIRHHHERWDGDGYLHRLAGEEIPLIARILAIGDAFSAMTTTRPYRKALDVREALTRLGDAASTQLDEHLVTTFITGIETAEDAPLPGADTPAALLWTPRRVA